LTVLQGDGTLDAWDLSRGALSGRWKLAWNYTAMCSAGAALYLSRQTGRGPVMETMALSALLEETAL